MNAIHGPSSHLAITAAAQPAIVAKLPLSDQSVDSLYVLGHKGDYLSSFGNIRSYLSEIKRVLQYGGVARIYPVQLDQFSTYKAILDKLEFSYYFKLGDRQVSGNKHTNGLLAIVPNMVLVIKKSLKYEPVPGFQDFAQKECLGRFCDRKVFKVLEPDYRDQRCDLPMALIEPIWR